MQPDPSILDDGQEKNELQPLPATAINPVSPVPDTGTFREFGDIKGTRQLIFDNIMAAAQKLEPASNPRHVLSVQNPRWQGPDAYSYAEQKQAVLSNGSLTRNLVGDIVLTDPTGTELARKRASLARIPWLTDRGTFIVGGNEYTMAHQMRLRPGIFTRRQQNGELESHVNVSKGYGHRIYLDPDSGIFRIKIGQARIPLTPLLRAMGVSDKQLRETWGNELTAANSQKDDPRAISKLYHKLYRDGDASEMEQKAAVVKAFGEMELDPDVTSRTLGQPFKNVGPDTLLAITKKLLRVSRGEEEQDDRDAMAYQTMMGPEDLFAERLGKAKHVVRQLLWKASARGNLDNLPTSPFNDSVKAALMSSGLGMPLEEINPADIFDQQVRVTRMGDGGIPSLDAVPDEARAVQPSQFGFVDFLRTPESGKVGVDARMARAAVKGKDGKIYTPVIGKDGQRVYKTPQDLANAVVAFPNGMKRNTPYVAALVNGKVSMVPRSQVDFEIPDMESTFSPLGNMIPLKSMVKGQRAVMAARMLTQALPLRNAEAPLVQSGIPGSDEKSFEEDYAKHMGAVRADTAGRVVAVDSDKITMVGPEGTRSEFPLYQNFPFNRKTFIHHTPTVQVGDTVKPGQLLARSNFTDGEGVTALGMNARVAYIPWGGLNFEDAIVVSQDFAKRMSSEHMYQNSHEWEKMDHKGRNAFISIFPSNYDRKTLDNFDSTGVIKPGTKVSKGDPLILIAREKERNKKSMIRGGKPSYQDASQVWEHEHDGVVTDVVHSDKGVSVVVKATMPMEVGDKLSGRFGDKGIISHIIPNDEMPRDKDGKPYEVLLNPLGVVSRTNPAQIVEAALGKLAALTGKPFKVPDFQDEEDLIEFAIKKLNAAGLADTESIIDPRNERKIDNIFTGNRWFMKLHHTAESKNQGRGLGAYTAEMTPAKGGKEGAKRIGMLETNALLSHGATTVVSEGSMVRGQANPQYWAQYMSGFKPATPKVPYVYDKFVNSLRASGMNVIRDGSRMHIMALTDDDIDRMAGTRELKNVETVDWKTMEPVKGGLFDPELTGGHQSSEGGGNRWSYIRLQEPLPNPVMEEPIRRVLGLTKNKLNDIIAGKEELNGQSGPGAIATALQKLNLDKEIAEARAAIGSGKKTARDEAIRKLGYLKSAKRLGIHPKQWVLSKAPVLPPAFRPVSTMGKNKLPLVADPNYLYKELFDANESLKKISERLGSENAGDERLGLYNAFKAVTGLGDPTHPKNQERQVKGILRHVFGNSPKLGTVQRRLLGSTTDLVGRSVIAPDPDLDMDQVGIPETSAWSIYKPIIIRRLVRRGMARHDAARAVEEKSAAARQAMLQEMDEGVVIINRAPTLHRYGMMAARPRLVRGDVLKVSPLVVAGFGADFDGDAMQYHVPTSDEAKQEALEKMLPSRNLFSAATFGVHFLPSQEYIGGLYEASAQQQNRKKPLTFATVTDAVRAYKQGRISVGQPVEIMER